MNLLCVGQMTFEGKVPSRWDCKPIMTKEYRSELKLREEKEKKKHRPLIAITAEQAPKNIRQKLKVTLTS